MKAPKPLYETVLVTQSLADGHVTSALMEVIGRIDTLNYITASFLRSEGGMGRDFAEGLHSLMEQQQLALRAIANRVGVWENERHADLTADAAENNRVADDVRRVREAFIGEAAKAGAEPQIIAQALNMKRSSIERVVAQLRGDASPVPAAATA